MEMCVCVCRGSHLRRTDEAAVINRGHDKLPGQCVHGCLQKTDLKTVT